MEGTPILIFANVLTQQFTDQKLCQLLVGHFICCPTTMSTWFSRSTSSTAGLGNRLDSEWLSEKCFGDGSVRRLPCTAKDTVKSHRSATFVSSSIQVLLSWPFARDNSNFPLPTYSLRSSCTDPSLLNVPLVSRPSKSIETTLLSVSFPGSR